MNPDTNELIRFGNEIEMKELTEKGFIPIPQTLEQAAKLMLGNKDSVFVSKTSGGKLSKWAAKKRREKIEQGKIVKKCNDYYMG